MFTTKVILYAIVTVCYFLIGKYTNSNKKLDVDRQTNTRRSYVFT